MMQAPKTLWNKIKATLMFVWRHLFTLFFSIDIIDDFLFEPYNPIIWRVCVVLGAAIAFDWLKMKFKGGTKPHSRFGEIKSHDWNRFTQGTTTGNVRNDSPYSERFIPGTTAWSVHSYSRDWDRFTPGTSAWNSRH